MAALADEVKRQWADEAVLRQARPVPLRVRWSSTGRPASPRSAVLDDRTAPDWHEAPLAGDVDGLIAAFHGLPRRQLVVIGEPGAGKSTLAMLLTLGLLRRPGHGEPVPMLAPLGSWNPTAENLETFLARRLAEDYAAFLRRHGPRPAGVAERLVAGGHLLPVLDGLDELPARWHGRAIEAVDRFAAAPGQALVLTCRSREYERAVRNAGQPLSWAAVVELQPVDVEEAVEYLSPLHPRPGTVGSRSSTTCAATATAPLARALSTPLLVTLARAAYRDPGGDPRDLLALPSLPAVTGALVRTASSPALPAGAAAAARRLPAGRPGIRTRAGAAVAELPGLPDVPGRHPRTVVVAVDAGPPVLAAQADERRAFASREVRPGRRVGAAAGLMHGKPGGDLATGRHRGSRSGLPAEKVRLGRHDEGYAPPRWTVPPGSVRNVQELVNGASVRWTGRPAGGPAVRFDERHTVNSRPLFGLLRRDL
jgi:hypothetical protein